MSLNRELSEEINKNNLSDAGNLGAVQYASQLFLEIKKNASKRHIKRMNVELRTSNDRAYTAEITRLSRKQNCLVT